MKAFALALLLPLVGSAALIPDVRAALRADDFAGAEKLIQDYRKQRGVTSEMLEAHSWLGRGALGQKRYEQAGEYAAETRRMCLELVKKQGVDADRNLPIALGASIEVQGQALAGLGQRSEGVSFLKTELAAWNKTSMRTRIQKNLHLLSLAGTAAPPLELEEWLGPKPPALAALQGKVVLLFFWAHWCADCKYQGPILAQLRDKYGPKGLVLLGPTQYYGYVAGGEDATRAREKPYIERIRKEFYSGLADMPLPLSEENFKTYGASTSPTLVLLDRKGVVRMYHPGRMTYEELANEIEKAL